MCRGSVAAERRSEGGVEQAQDHAPTRLSNCDVDLALDVSANRLKVLPHVAFQQLDAPVHLSGLLILLRIREVVRTQHARAVYFQKARG